MSETWTIGELAERAAAVLGAQAGPVNGRVREVPGERLIRWYTTIGLVDPPLTRRGRVAQYGPRHLLQLVAIKRLQAAGRSIAEIQADLTGATDTMLERAAHLKTPSPEGSSPERQVSEKQVPEKQRFWAQRPVPAVPPVPSTLAAPAEPGPVDTGPGRQGAIQGVRLAPGVTLLLDGASRTPSEEDIEAVRAAAGPLLAVLEERRLRHEGSAR